MEKIDVTQVIDQFDEHLKANDRVLFSAKFGDGKTSFLNEFMEAKRGQYEFIVLYPVNYQIAPNEAIMEYIKRDILFQLIVKGYLKSGVCIPEHVLFQWYLSQKCGSLFTDVMQVVSSFPVMPEDWKGAVTTLMAISGEVTKQIDSFKQFKKDIESADELVNAAQIIENLSSGTGNIYELDIITYLIVSTIQKVKNEGVETVLVIEDLDRVDPAHLFRILNVFSAHIDRVYQCSDRMVKDSEGNEIPADTLKNKFGFDKVVMVLDYDTTENIFRHFYGARANYLGYISKFMSHNVFQYSITKHALRQLVQHLNNKCGVSIDMILSRGKDGKYYVDKDELSVRKIAQVLDSFDDSIMYTVEVIEGSQACFAVSTPFTRTISTLRRLGMNDESIFMLITEQLNTIQLLQMMGGFLMRQMHTQQSYSVYYKGVVYDFQVENMKDGTIRFGKCTDREVRSPEQYKFLEVDIYDAFMRACSYVK